MNREVRNNVSKLIYRDIKQIVETDLPYSDFDGKTVLITGAAGFISYYMVMSLLLRNDLYHSNIQVIGIVRNLEKAREKYGAILDRDDIIFYHSDITDAIEIEHKADYLIHAASQASAWFFENDPVGTINANLIGTNNVLRYALEHDCKATLLISSLKTYGVVKNGERELREEAIGYIDHTSYKNCYAIGKRSAETLCASYNKQYGTSVKIARPCYIYGPTAIDDDRVWAQFFANVVRNENIMLKSNGASLRSFCYVVDTVTALFTILLRGQDGKPYNIATDNSNVTIRDFAKITLDVFESKKLTLTFFHKEDKEEPILDVTGVTPEVLNSDALNKLGWKAQISLQEGIRRAIEIMEEQYI